MSMENVERVWKQARDWEVEAGRVYWPTLRGRLEAERLGPIETVAGVFCALSPNNTEANNYRDTVNLMKDQQATTTTYPKCKERAVRIMDGDHPAVVLGRKTGSMWHNIVWPDARTWVTVDGHMYSVWVGKRVTMDKARVTEKLYGEIAEVVKEIAGRKRVPNAVQATVWMAWKRIHRIVYQPQLSLAFDTGTEVDVEA